MKNIYVVIFLLLGIGSAKAQTIYDAQKFGMKDLSGTARFVGMGGALGALGADISTMSVNPAGTGLYRKNDFSATLNYTNSSFDGDYLGSKFDISKSKTNLGTLGFVISTNIRNSALKYVNFGFNYTRVANFNNRVNASAGMGYGTTYAMQLAAMANSMPGDVSQAFPDKGPSPYRNGDYGWLGLQGYQGHVIELNNEGAFESKFNDSQGSAFTLKETGGIDQYDFNVSFNISDRAFFGFTLGAYSLRYNSMSTFREDYRLAVDNKSLEWMASTTDTYTRGAGVDFKFGTIVRPFESSPFRIGLAVHTPMFYNLTRYSSMYFDSDVWGKFTENGQQMEGIIETSVDTYENNWYGGYNAFDYKLRTPWKLNLSLGHNIGTVLALGLEYEYQDYSSSKFSYDDEWGGRIHEINNQTGMLKKVHTIRFGGEFKFIPQVAFRFGYNLETAGFEKDAYKNIIPNSVQTDTYYFNKDGVRNTFTIGTGYSGKMWYADLTYKFDTRKMNFRPYDNSDLPFSKVTQENNTVLFTVGLRM